MVPPFQHYQLGDTLSLAVDEDDPSPKTIRVRIQKLKTRTMSCTMVVQVDSNDNNADSDLGRVQQPVKTAFLKLYDRRFANSLRRSNVIDPWEPDMENAYINAIQAGTIYEFLQNLHQVENFKNDTEEDWDDAQNEAFLADTLLQHYTNEVAVYQALHKFQGEVMPRLIAAVDLNLTPPDTQSHELLHVKGILLEYVDGFSLEHLADHAPRFAWQGIVDQAVTVVQVLGDYNIVDYDRRLENFLVSPRGNDSFHVFMIDFGHCRFKREDESEREFGKAKAFEDEEGGVGMLLQKVLRNRRDFDLLYTRSGRYDKWKEGEDGELWEKYGKIILR